MTQNVTRIAEHVEDTRIVTVGVGVTLLLASTKVKNPHTVRVLSFLLNHASFSRFKYFSLFRDFRLKATVLN